MKDAPVRHALEYALFWPIAHGVAALSVPAARKLGRGIGACAWLVPSGPKRTALQNLERAFPDLPASERRRIAREAFRHFGGTFLETLALLRLEAPDLCARVRWEGYEHLLAAEADGKGVIVQASHFGCWEVIHLALAATSKPLASMGRPLDNPHVDRWLQRLRTRFGSRSLPKRGAVREMFRILERGERLGVLLDQRVRPQEGIEVSFFGHPVWTSPLAARLALRTGAPVVGAEVYPEPGGSFRFRFRPPLRPHGPDTRATTAAFTQELVAQDEVTIRARPELWFWFHDRWKR